MTENEIWLTKQLTRTIELVDRVAIEVSNINTRLKKIENPDVEKLLSKTEKEMLHE